MTARLDADFVVFLIGMRVNKWWRFWKHSIYNDMPVWGLLPGIGQRKAPAGACAKPTELVVRF